MRKLMCLVPVTLIAAGLLCFPAVSSAQMSAGAKSTNVPNLEGNWVGYYEDGTKSEYVWAIHQTGSTLSIENVGGKTAKSKGRIEGNKVIAQDFATQNGKLSADGAKITWTDGVVWKRSGNLSGNWTGYYQDGTKSEYVWSIHQTGSTLSIKNVGGKEATSKGRIEGKKVFAEDFATKEGALSGDGTRITWTDGVVWVKQ